MMRNTSELDQAVSRTLRDSLQKIQRTAEELDHAVNDLVAACASTRPANSLSPMLRAQGAAASLSSSLEVLSRFVIGAMHPASGPAAGLASAGPMESQPQETVAELEASNSMVEGDAPSSHPAPAQSGMDSTDELPPLPDLPGDDFHSSESADPLPQSAEGFDVAALVPEERELHRRADRVAKVAMQDIKMLRPDQVSLGKERKDLCARLGDDIERARKEYDRRFQAILGHPVDYFYNRMVEILGDGDPSALGEYPYPSPVLRR